MTQSIITPFSDESHHATQIRDSLEWLRNAGLKYPLIVNTTFGSYKVDYIPNRELESHIKFCAKILDGESIGIKTAMETMLKVDKEK